MPFKAQHVFPHERNVSACVLSFRLVCCSLGTRPRRAPSPPEPGTDGEGKRQLSRLCLLHRKKTIYFPGARRTAAGLPPAHPRSPERGRRGREGPRGPDDPVLRSCSRRAGRAASALVAVPEDREAAAIPAPPSPRQHPLSTPADPRALRDPGESSSARANSGEAAKLFHPGRPGDAGMEPPESTYPEVLSRSLRRPSEALPPRPARGRPERAAGAGEALPKRPTPGGGAAGAARGGGAEAALRGRAGCARGWGRPARSAPAGCRWISACPPPGPGITWPGPPAAAPDTGSRRKPEAARPRGLRRPLPTPAAACLGLAPPAPSPATGGGSEPGEREVAPWWRRPRAPDPTDLAWAPPERGVGCRLLKGDVPGPREPQAVLGQKPPQL